MMDLKNTIIDPIYFNVWWEAIQKGYDAKTLLYSIHADQIDCKKWLVDNLPYDELIKWSPLSIQLYGGWFGYPLIDMLLENLNVDKITNIDLDTKALDLCRKYTAEKNLSDVVFFKERNVTDIIETSHNKDKDIRLVINTSSEHMPDLPVLIKNKTYTDNCVFALQSNNMTYVDDHINCSESLDHFIEKSGLTKIWFSDSHTMNNGYDRYMVIGSHE